MAAGAMTPLDRLESESIYILREAFHAMQRLGLLWSFGKDSTVLVHLCRKAFFGRVPFPLIHCDTGLEMPETYAFRDRYAGEWKLDLITQPCPALEATDATLPPAARVAARKTLGLKQAIQTHGFTGIIAGIRRDEEATRAKERVFSPRGAEGEWASKDQPPEFWGFYNTDLPPGAHMRIHPLLGWTEIDVWRYIERENVPVVELYFAKAGKRYRSIGEQGITHPVESTAATIAEIISELEQTRVAERSGRPMGADVDESSFERLRNDGYM